MSLLIIHSIGKEINFISKIINEKYPDSKIIEIKDLNKKNGFLSNLRNNYNAILSNNTLISPERVDFSDVNLILLGSPSTFGNISPAISTFIQNNDFSDKNVIIYTTTNSKQGTGVLKQMKKLVEKKGANVVNSFIIRVNDKTDRDLMVNTIKLLPQLDIDLYM